MDSFELNKIFGAITGMFGVYLAVSIVTEAMYHPGGHGHGDGHEKLAYALEVETGGGHDDVDKEEVSIASLLPEADPAGGEKGFRKCQSCHNIEPGGAAKTGPNLWGIVGRDIAAADGFSYSDDLAGKEGDWTFAALGEFLANPRGFAPGTKMSFAGIKKPEDLADMLVYLNQQSDSPEPLPEPEAEAAEGASAPTE